MRWLNFFSTSVFIFLSYFGQVHGGAVDKSLLWKERPRLDRVYPVYYTIDSSKYFDDKIPRSFVEWSLIYLMRGSGLQFIRTERTDVRKLLYEFVNEPILEDIPTVSKELTSVIKVNFDQPTLRSIIRQTLYALGMIFEHQRVDRKGYILLNDEAEKLFPLRDKDVVLVTPYDTASIMHPRLVKDDIAASKGISLIPSYDTKLVYGARSFLSTCDWATLHSMYPDVKKKERCVPGKMRHIVLPSSTLIRYFNMNGTKANETCYYNDSGFTEVSGCRLVDGEPFPSIPNKNEVYVLPSSMVKEKTVAYYCLNYVSTAPEEMSTNECIQHCAKSCHLLFGTITIKRCMNHKFPLCRRIQDR